MEDKEDEEHEEDETQFSSQSSNYNISGLRIINTPKLGRKNTKMYCFIQIFYDYF